MSGSGTAGFTGGVPQVSQERGNPEGPKYFKMWQKEEYRVVSPGEVFATTFLQQAQPRANSHVLDLGCGTGRGALMLALLGGLRVTMLDFARNCLDKEVEEATTTQKERLQFIQADLEKPIPVMGEYGFCCDVLEHIPPETLDATLDNILESARHVFFSISTVDDACGKLIGEKLHLSVHPYEWWMEKFKEKRCFVQWSENQGEVCLFYLTAWDDGQKVVDNGVLNVSDDTIISNVKENIKGNWHEVTPHEINHAEVMLVGGGPSLRDFEEEIKKNRGAGMLLVTLNGSYNWAIERGLVPSATFVVDAREFNKRFTKPVVEKCLYFIASQCHPAVFEGLPPERTYIWHAMTEKVTAILNERYPLWYGVPGGTTVLLRAIPLLRMLGYHKFHLYGCDSCIEMPDYEAEVEKSGYREGKIAGEPCFDWTPRHHAYPQLENDSRKILPVMVTGGRVFQCHLWMVAQAQEFMTMIKLLGDEIELAVYGDGLLAHILRTGEAMAVMDEKKVEVS